MRKLRSKIILILLGLAAVGGIALAVHYNNTPGTLDEFTRCLKEKGATFYGAFWCPHCQKEKAMFGKSARLLPYVECSTADGNGQLQVCQDKKISGYPTWEFTDGSRETGETSLQVLSEKTNCQLP